MQKSSNFWYHIAAILIVGIWGTTFISTKTLLLHGLRPEEVFCLRFIIAYVGMWILYPKKFFCDNLRDELMMLILGISGGSFYFWTENTALLHSQACNVSFIVCTTPLITSLLSLAVKNLFPKSRVASGLGNIRMTGWLAIGTVFAVIGMAMVIFNGQHSLHLSPLGDLLALGASISWAVYSVIMMDIAKKYDTRLITRKVFFYGLLTILPSFIINPWDADFTILKETPVYLNILFLGIVASLGCFACWNPVMKRLGIVTASNYIYLNPIFTLIGSILILNEKITPMSGIGSAIILLGVILAGRKSVPSEN